MILKNLAVMFPIEIWTILTKFAKTKIDEPTAEYIEKNGLYHFVPNEKVAEMIKQSGYIKESNSVLSYGVPSAFMFAGKPDIDAFIKNMASSAENNPLMHPEKVFYAIKINPDKRDLSNYKMRVQDNVILHEGKCILQDEKVEIKQLVIDLIKDKNGNKVLGFRERTKEEIEQTITNLKEFNGRLMAIPNATFTRHIPSEECRKAIEEEKNKSGYKFNGNVTNFSHIVQIDNEKSKQATKSIWNKFRNFLNQFTKGNRTKEIAENPNVKIKRIISDIEQGRIDTKRPVLSERYVNSIIDFKKHGLEQKRMSDVMQSLESNKILRRAQYIENNLDKSEFPASRIHGINHSRRVATLACAIMQGENINLIDKEADILMTACYCHDIGRILDIGPHAQRSVKKLEKMKLFHEDGTEYSLEDRKLLYFLVEGHEGKDGNNVNLLNKYKISEEERAKYIQYLSVIKDADALDRARTSTKNIMDLNAKYLRLDTSKELIDFSFGLEALSRNVRDNSYMFFEKTEADRGQTGNSRKNEENEFFKSLQSYKQNERYEVNLQTHDKYSEIANMKLADRDDEAER